MSDAISTGTPEATARPRRVWTVGIAAFIAAVGFTAYGTFTGSDRSEDLASYAILAAAMAVATVVIFTFVVGRSLRKGDASRMARSGVISGLIGLLSVWAFWSGLPVLLGSAALLLGTEARGRAGAGETGRGSAVAAIVLGALAVAGQVLASVTDQLAS